MRSAHVQVLFLVMKRHHHDIPLPVRCVDDLVGRGLLTRERPITLYSGKLAHYPKSLRLTERGEIVLREMS